MPTVSRRVPTLDDNGQFPDRYAPPSVAVDAATAEAAAVAAAASAAGVPAAVTAAVESQVTTLLDPQVTAAETARTGAELAQAGAVSSASLAQTARSGAETASIVAATAGTNAVVAAGVPPMASTAGCQAIARNASTALTTPTYDDTGKAVHPTVCWVPGGLGGFEWWMALTPYATGNAVENPSILASHDGLTWQVPPGLTNPIVPRPSGGDDFNSDPYLMHHDGLLWCFYRTNIASPLMERLYYKTSTDGVVWSAAVLVLATDHTVSRLVSPSVVHYGGQWHLWGIEYLSTPNVIWHYKSTTTPTDGQWSAPDICTVSNTAATFEPWHADIHRDGVELVAIIHETVNGTSTAGGHLRRAVSTDGITWTGDKRPFLRGNVGSWDAQQYRGCARPAMVDGVRGYRLWYSALSGSANWHVGHTTVTLRRAGDVEGPDLPAACWPLPPYLAGDKVDRANAATPGTLTSGQAWTLLDGTVPVVSKTLASVTGNVRITLGVHDVEVGATVRAVPAVGFASLVAAGSGTTDYVQFGMNGPGAYQAAVRIANVGGTTPGSISFVPVIGDRVAIRVTGVDAWCLLNDVVVGRADVTALAANTQVGCRFALGSGAAGAYSDFYAIDLTGAL